MTEALAQLIYNSYTKGKLEVIETVVRNMAADGFSFDQIVRLTGASADDVRKIMDNIATSNQVQIS